MKSEVRRQAILETAAQIFRERGFDATSMSEVSSKLGGSKATLYNYFCSKEQLFATVMLEQVRDEKERLLDALEHAGDLPAAIRRLAPAYLRVALHPDALAISRICVAEGDRCGFGKAYYEEGPKRAWLRMAARLERAMDAGEFRRDDPWRAALYLRALLEVELVEPILRGWCEAPTEGEVEEAAAAAAEIFLRAYAP